MPPTVIELIQNAGGTTTALELNQYDRPRREDGQITEAEIGINVRINYKDEQEDENPYRVK